MPFSFAGFEHKVRRWFPGASIIAVTDLSALAGEGFQVYVAVVQMHGRIYHVRLDNDSPDGQWQSAVTPPIDELQAVISQRTRFPAERIAMIAAAVIHTDNLTGVSR